VVHDTVRLRQTRAQSDDRLARNVVTTPMPDSLGAMVFVPVVPLDTVTAVLHDERAACDSAIRHLTQLVAAYRRLDTLTTQQVRVEKVGGRRVSAYVQPMWEPLTQTPVAEGGVTVRLVRRAYLVASGGQRFFPGEAPRLRLGARVEW
jgi:hypothetical protein